SFGGLTSPAQRIRRPRLEREVIVPSDGPKSAAAAKLGGAFAEDNHAGDIASAALQRVCPHDENIGLVQRLQKIRNLVTDAVDTAQFLTCGDSQRFIRSGRWRIVDRIYDFERFASG